MSHRRLLLENIGSLALLQGLNYAVPLVTLPYLVNVLQPSHFGSVSFAQGIVLYFDFFTDFGFNFSATRSIATCRQNTESVSRIFWATIYSKLLLMCVSAVALALLVVFVPRLRETPRLFAVNFLYVIGTVMFPIWLFQGLERIKAAAAIFGAARLLTIPALFLFVRGPQDYVIAAAIQASVEVVASIVAWPIIWKDVRLTWHPPLSREIADTLKRAWPLFLSTSALQLSTNSTTVALGFVSSQMEVGYFSAADKLIKAAITAMQPLGQALYPHITAARLRSRMSALQLIRKAFFAIGLLSLCVSVATAFCAGPVCHLVFGKSFEHSVAVLQCLSPLPLLFGLNSVFGTQTMLVFEMDGTFSRIMLLSALIAVPVTICLSISFGAIGAAMASVTIAALTVSAMALALRSTGMHIWRHSSQQISMFAQATGLVGSEE